jgi:hypothetical protein
MTHNYACRMLPLLIFPLLAAAGCGTVDLQKTGRTSSEQLLTTLTIEEAVTDQNVEPWVKDKYVRVEVVGLNGADLEFLKKVMEKHVLESGGKIALDPEKAHVILSTMVNSTGTDTQGGRWFLPIPVPTLADSSLSLGSLTFYQKSVLVGRCRLWVFAVTPAGELIEARSPTYAEHYLKNHEILGITVDSSSDVPEIN